MRTRLARQIIVPLMGVALVAGACGKKASGGAAGLAVTDIELGRSLNADRSIAEKTTTFRPSDVIYVSIGTRGAGDGTLAARWTFEGNQQVATDSRTLSASGPARTEFHVSKSTGWPQGRYRVEITLNGVSAGTEEFEVKQ